MAEIHYIPVTVEGKHVGFLPQPNECRLYYEYQLTVPDNNDPVFIKLRAGLDTTTLLPCELRSCSVALLDRIEGFVPVGVMAAEAATDADGPPVPLPAKPATERVVPPFPLIAYRVMVD